MDNGHIYPSEYALHLNELADYPVTQEAVVDELRRCYPSDWPRLWGTIWSHREA